MYGIYESGNIIARFSTPLTVKSNHPVFVSDTLSLSRKVSRRTAQRWEIEARLEPLSLTAQDLFVNIASKGYSETVFVVMPQNYGAVQARTASGTPTLVGTKGQPSGTISGLTGLIPKGTFIKATGHDKIYMTTADRTGDGSISIYPDFVSDINALIQWEDNVIMSCLYDIGTISGMTYTDGILMDVGVIKLVERF